MAEESDLWNNFSLPPLYNSTFTTTPPNLAALNNVGGGTNFDDFFNIQVPYPHQQNFPRTNSFLNPSQMGVVGNPYYMGFAQNPNQIWFAQNPCPMGFVRNPNQMGFFGNPSSSCVVNKRAPKSNSVGKKKEPMVEDEESRQKRLMKNRESAYRVRCKKKDYFRSLQRKVNNLQEDNAKLRQQVEEAEAEMIRVLLTETLQQPPEEEEEQQNMGVLFSTY